MGQSNMLGEGKIGSLATPTAIKNSLANAVAVEGKYPYLYDKTTKNWTTSTTVRNVFVMGSGGVGTSQTNTNAWMNGGSGHKGSIGPELGIGGMLEAAFPTKPIMMLKSCIGDRALGWDLLPPGSKGYEFDNFTYAGYHQSPMKWPKGTTPVPMGWAAGLQYDGDIWRANQVLANLSTYYPAPAAECYEVAGFFWWQGDKDSRDMGLSTHYEENLVALIKQLRVQYNVPKAKFVSASLGQTSMNDTKSGGGLILQAMENVANGEKYPEFKGSVATVYTHPLLHTPGSSGGHYGDDAETYMNVGEMMGKAMAMLLKEPAEEH